MWSVDEEKCKNDKCIMYKKFFTTNWQTIDLLGIETGLMTTIICCNAYNSDNGPNINLVHDPRWRRAQEVYSEHTRLSGHLGYEFITGMQFGGLQNNKYWLMGSQCKHYGVYDIESIPQSRLEYNAITDAVNWAETCIYMYTCIS